MALNGSKETLYLDVPSPEFHHGRMEKGKGKEDLKTTHFQAFTALVRGFHVSLMKRFRQPRDTVRKLHRPHNEIHKQWQYVVYNHIRLNV